MERESSRRGAKVRRSVARWCAASATAALVAVGTASPAAAHVSITPSTTAAGAYAVLEVSVPHGCAGSATTEVSIQMPDQVVAVTPTRNALWEVEKELEKLDPPVTDSHGAEVTERVAAVTYRASSPLPEGYRDVFELSLRLPDAAGERLVFPTIQTCVEGEAAWIEVAEDGQDAEELELPAPAFVLTAADSSDPRPSATEVRADPEPSEDSGSSDALAIAALAAGLLGAVLGGTALVRHRRRT